MDQRRLGRDVTSPVSRFPLRRTLWAGAVVTSVTCIIVASLQFLPVSQSGKAVTGEEGVGNVAPSGISKIHDESGSRAEIASEGNSSENSLAEHSDLSEFRAILLERSGDLRTRRFLELLEKMPSKEAFALLQVLDEFEKLGLNLKFEKAAFWRKWGELDPKAALGYLDSLPGKHPARGEGMEQLFRGWAAKDPDAAKQWLSANPAHQDYEPAFLGFIGGQATRDLNAATRIVIGTLSQDDPLLPKAMHVLAENALRNGFVPGLKQWFDSLPGDSSNLRARRLAGEHVYQTLVQRDFSATADWIAIQAGTPWRNNGTIGNFASRLAGRDPEAAMQWVANLPPDPRNGILIGVGETVQQWVNKNPQGFETWLNTARGTQLFEQAAYDYAMILSRSNKTYDKALLWAGQIASEKNRQEVIRATQKKTAKPGAM